jgi:hypothetical protein
MEETVLAVPTYDEPPEISSSDSDLASINTEDADEVFDGFWSGDPEDVGAQLRSLEEASSRRSSRHASVHYGSDREEPGEGDLGIIKTSSEVAKKLKEAADEDARQADESEKAEKEAESTGRPESLAEEVDRFDRVQNEALSDAERRGLERLTRVEGSHWGVPGGLNQFNESGLEGGLEKFKQSSDRPQEAEIDSAGESLGGEEAESRPRGKEKIEVVPINPLGYAEAIHIHEDHDAGSKGPVGAFPSPRSPLEFDFETSEASASESGGKMEEVSSSADSTPREERSLSKAGEKERLPESGGDQLEGFKRCDSWDEKGFAGRAFDVMESLAKMRPLIQWLQSEDWPALV